MTETRFKIEFSEQFWISYKKLTKGDANLGKRIHKAVELLAQNPKHPSLNSHAVTDRNGNAVWSSWVTGDVRIIWIYDEQTKSLVVIINTGKHSGSSQIYLRKSS